MSDVRTSFLLALACGAALVSAPLYAAPTPHPETVEPPAAPLLPPVAPTLMPSSGNDPNVFDPLLSPTNAAPSVPMPDLTVEPDPAAPRRPDTPFVGALRRAYASYDSGDFDNALVSLTEADALQPCDLNVYTMRATCYLKKKQFAQAEEWYRKALEIDPNAQAPRFNLAETCFLSKQYAKARIRFDALLKSDPGNDVLRYKVYLCALSSRQYKEADSIRRHFDIMAYTPVYHYAQAAWHFQRGESDEAHDWIYRAQQAYHPRDFIIFEDSLISLGFLPNPFANKGSGASPKAAPPAPNP